MKEVVRHPIRRVLVVEEDPEFRRLVEYITKLNPDYEVHSFSTGKDCLENLHLNPDIVTTDLRLPDMSGKELLEKVKKFNSKIAVIVMAGDADVPAIVDVIKNGAANFIPKNSKVKEELLKTYNRLMFHLDLKKDVRNISENFDQKYNFKQTIIGDSPAVELIFRLLEKAAKSDITVSITGETGTGKELAAQAIHFNSRRKHNKFVAVNVAAIPRDLLESELFGYEKGAFTSANHRKLGQFEFADKGTLFLDEIAEMDLSLQVKLLRALQEREFQRVGGNETIKFDSRIIVATNKDLAQEVENGNFREDLYYRLLGLPIHLPPLRERGRDVIKLASYFLNNLARKDGGAKFDLTNDAIIKLMSYNYPGNIRELKATIELAAVMAEGEDITANDISFNSPKSIQNILIDEVSLKEYTERIIHHYLEKYDNNVILVAKKLQIGKSTIYRMLKGEKGKTEDDKDENK